MSEQHGARWTASAVVVAGGSGQRFGASGGKQLADVAGAPVLSHTIRAFDQTPAISKIVVVAHPDRVAEYTARAVEPYGFTTPITVVAGGDTRQRSVANGLACVDDADFVVVHDGARPLVTPDVITGSMTRVAEDDELDGVIVGHPAYDTLKLVDDGRVVETPDRSRFWVAQTPQVFRTDSLRRAYDSAIEHERTATDDAGLVEAAGGVIGLVQGPRVNIKVTLAEDLDIVEAVVRHRRQETSDE